jgi:type II secretory pathway pseudopilin PulG
MNRRQKAILINFVTVIIITAAAVVAMINFKDWVNRSESLRAMEHLSKMVQQYRKEQGSIPPQSYIDSIRENLAGGARLGIPQYRGRWVDFDSPPDMILAYSEKNYGSSFLESGFVVLRFNGQVEWIERQKFLSLLAKQQSPAEIQMTPN